MYLENESDGNRNKQKALFHFWHAHHLRCLSIDIINLEKDVRDTYYSYLLII